jgi:hypothetical protein
VRGGSDNCMSYFLQGNDAASGHRWCRDCWNAGRSADTFAAEPPCTHTVEPDSVRIAGRVFQLNGTMAKSQRERLIGLFGKDVRAASIPSEFDEFEIPDDDPEQ